MSALSLRQIGKSLGSVPILHAIDIDVAAGEFAVILGPSGCGKSTLLRLIAGLETPSAGAIFMDGQDVTHLEPARRGCAMVFQSLGLYPHMTVAENIAYPLKVARTPSSERRRRVEAAAASVGMADFLNRRSAQLSGGQRQRVAIARAIVRRPRLFLFDEPLSSLDAQLRADLRVEIKRLHQDIGTTSLFVTHDQTEAMSLADRLILMNEGRVEQVGKPLDLYRHPVNRFVASFLGSPPMNFIPAAYTVGVWGLPSGQTVPFPVPPPAAPGRFVLGIRPEHLELVDGQQQGGLDAVITLIEELGSHRVVHLRAGDVSLVTTAAMPLSAHVGDAVTWRSAVEHIHIFGESPLKKDVSS